VNVLVLNSGSSSVKFQLIQTSLEQIACNQERLLAKGAVEKIGTAEAEVSYQPEHGERTRHVCGIADHKRAIEAAFECLARNEGAPLVIDAVGHRIVHGGEHFSDSVLIDDEVVRQVESCSELAPLHNPPNIKGYYAARVLLPHAPHVAVFDTAFHQTLPPKAYLYGLPYESYQQHRVRRYGFHGSSHRYVSWRYAQIQRAPVEQFKLVTIHLGNGCSMCAVEYGRSVETSMGFTPLEGLMMGTRAGDLDSGALLYLLGVNGLALSEADDLLNRRSGLLGVSGVSNDLRDVLREAERGDRRATLAFEVYCHRVKKYLGAYLAVLNGADAVIFTGGVGEHRAPVRNLVCASLDRLGIKLDQERNAAASGVESCISELDSATEVWVIPTNEELVIARDTLRCILQ
jgi:acetate kinase